MNPNPLDRTLVVPALVRSRADTDGDSLFMVDSTGASVTFAACHDQVLRYVDLLSHLGVGAADRVAVMLPTSIDEQCLWLACGWIGALQVPVNPALRGDPLRHVLNDSSPSVVIASLKDTTAIDEVRDDSDGPHVAWDSDTSAPAGWESGIDVRRGLAMARIGRGPEPWDTAAVIYTSGTTGPAKGVLTPWGQLASGISAFHDLCPGDRLYAPFAPFHLSGKLPVQLMAYWTGTWVFRDGFKTDRFWADVRSWNCNRAWLFHAMAKFIWDQAPQPSDADNPLESVTGGPVMVQYRELEARFRFEMRTNYGMTEAGWPITSGAGLTDHRSSGRRREGYELMIVDEYDREVAEGQVGELLLRPRVPWTTSKGYLGHSAATAESWRNGWFHTGDAFRIDDGQYYFIDRMRDTIRRRSETISSFDVESMVLAHSGVAECAALGVPSEFGEEEIKVFVVRADGCDLTAPELWTDLRTSMPRFMVPRYIEFVDDLSKTVTGRVRKFQLRDMSEPGRTWDALSAGTNR